MKTVSALPSNLSSFEARDNAMFNKGLEAAAEAVSDFNFRNAIKQLEDVNIPIILIETTIMEIIACKDDRTRCILAFALMDDLVIYLMKRNMNPKFKGGLSKIFEYPAMLSSASDRFNLASALGWIADETRNDLDLFRKMRNHFAHKVTARSFADDPIAGWLSSMNSPKSAVEQMKEALVIHNPRINVRNADSYEKHELFILNITFLVKRTVEEILAFPIAQKYFVDPHHLLLGMGENTNNTKKMWHAMVRAIWPLLATNMPFGDTKGEGAGHIAAP